ncbi:diacylglycerol/lipid kinase family protein [Azospirillum isscasi]|uniref:Diacylglycerol kinase family lipid kinase n=1 Tax=Azospirillum isscasi TaxID=3053926 RepID=A0ABU0WN82_9PROT|nr:diacylglycerol kinase family protein [Azospirillum isscasi]MDQ2105670.1 diacylglycerol kinase family lipid kinase [Azospirillum isscasi]
MPEPAGVPRRRFLVIHNPVAGPRRARRLRAVLAVLEQRYGAAVTLQATGGRGDAEAMARAVAPGAFDAVIAAGGDGTINEVVNGLGARGAEGAAIPLGVVPLGTANVLAHELGLPPDAEGTARVLAEGRALPVHLGVANGRAFAMMAGAGLDARVVERVDPRLKRLIGKGAYAVETLARLAAGGGGPYRVTVDGGEPVEAASVIVAKGHFYGGRFVCAPDARLTDPRLHVCLFSKAGRGNALRYIWGVTAGRLPRFPDYRILPARRVVVEGPAGDPVQGDGDVIARLPVDIALAPWVLPVLAP